MASKILCIKETPRQSSYNDAEAFRLQQILSDAWTPAMHEGYLAEMAKSCGPLFTGYAHQPVILPPSIRDAIFAASSDIVEKLRVQNIPELRGHVVPESHKTREPLKELPGCFGIDFAVTRDEKTGKFHLDLIEIQAAPNYFNYAVAASKAWIDILSKIPDMPKEWSWLQGDKSHDEFETLVGQCILGAHEPGECALVDIGLAKQTTRFEFIATHNRFGIPLVDIEALTQKGDTLHRPGLNGEPSIPVKRVYYRALAEQIGKEKPDLKYEMRTLSTEWFPNPGDHIAWDKGLMPYLKGHPNVPATVLLSDAPAETRAGDLSDYVLKRVTGYGGTAIFLNITREKIDAIPPTEWHEWCLQKKVTYSPWLTPCGPDSRKLGTELRVVMIKPDGAPEMFPAYVMPRCARGKLFNAGRVDGSEAGIGTGTGVTIALWPIMQ